jgi:hypothetical protein
VSAGGGGFNIKSLIFSSTSSLTPSGSNDSLSSTTNHAAMEPGSSHISDPHYFDEKLVMIKKHEGSFKHLLKSLDVLIKQRRGIFYQFILILNRNTIELR